MSPPGKPKVGGPQIFFARSAREFVPPTFKIVAPPLSAIVTCWCGRNETLVQISAFGLNGFPCDDFSCCYTIFTAPCYSNGAVMPSYDVRLSVTLMDADHIC